MSNVNKETLQKLSRIFTIEFEGSTLEDAIKKATASLKVSPEEFKIKVLSEGEPGLFGLKGSKPAKIKVTPNNEKIGSFIKFFLINLLSFAKDAIVFIDTIIEDNNITITVILNDSNVLNNIQKKEVFNSISLLTNTFISRILPNYRLILNFKMCFTSNQ